MTIKPLPCQAPAYQGEADWFPDNNGTPEAKRAVELCGYCPISMRCAAEALNNGIPYGTWGGLTSQDRRTIWSNRVDQYPAGMPATFTQGYQEIGAHRPVTTKAHHERGYCPKGHDLSEHGRSTSDNRTDRNWVRCMACKRESDRRYNRHRRRMAREGEFV